MQALASAAEEAGSVICTEASVKKIVVDGVVKGVELTDGRVIESELVLSNASPHTTFLDLLPSSALPEEFVSHIAKSWNVESSSTKVLDCFAI